MSGSHGLARRNVAVAATLAASLCVVRLTGCYPNPDALRAAGAQPGITGCADFAAAWCTRFNACQPVIANYTFGTVATCRQRMAGYCTTILTAETDTGWTATALASCAAPWSTMACADWINDPSEFPGAACRIPGKRTLGASCFRDLQCASDLCLFANDTDSCGTCVALRTQGQPCFSAGECAVGLGCSDSGACAAWGKTGDPCGAARPCLGTLQCAGGVCAALAGPGAACSATVACDLSQGLLCNLTTNRCGAAIAGNTCDSAQSDGRVLYCTAGGQCNSDDGSCTPSAADGQACSDSGAQCLFPAFCSTISQVCKQPTTVACGGGGVTDAGPPPVDSGTPHTDAGPPPVDSGTPSTDNAVAAFTGALCNHFQTCAPRRLTQVYGTVAICQARLKLSIQSVLGLPDTGWTAASLMACASAQTAQSCVDFDDGKLPAACDLAGARANGRGCRSPDQCASTHCTATATGCGTCAARGGASAACASDDDCQRSLICAVGGLTGGQCVTPGALGATCNPASTPCRYSLSCRSGVCSTPGLGGATCADHEDCDDRNGWLCNGTTGRCGLAVGGTTCAATTDGTVPYCSNDGYCTTAGTCIAAAADNQACSATGAQCLFPAACTGARCVLPPSTDCP